MMHRPWPRPTGMRILGGLAALVLVGAALAAPSSPDVEMFTREGCAYCAAALAFLEELRRERPGLRIQVRDVQEDRQALEQLVSSTGSSTWAFRPSMSGVAW